MFRGLFLFAALAKAADGQKQRQDKNDQGYHGSGQKEKNREKGDAVAMGIGIGEQIQIEPGAEPYKKAGCNKLAGKKQQPQERGKLLFFHKGTSFLRCSLLFENGDRLRDNRSEKGSRREKRRLLL